jgi:hypothetical protein
VRFRGAGRNTEIAHSPRFGKAAPDDASVNATELQRALALVRDAARDPGERALTAAFLAARRSLDAPVEPEELPADPSQRMFAYGIAHGDAMPWDGRSMRSGTITYIGSDRVEQYVGNHTWIAYTAHLFGETMPRLGDQLRIARRNGSIEFEHIAPNRFAATPIVRNASSGMVVVRRTPLEKNEIEETAASVAQRYAASFSVTPESAVIDFGGSASCRMTTTAASPVGSIRLEVAVRSDLPEAALRAERALLLSAALLTLDGESFAVDDSSAIFTAECLFGLAETNSMRADAFAFAAAAAQSQQAPLRTRIFDGFLDELTLFFAHSSAAEDFRSTLTRAFSALFDAAQSCEDPTVPPYIAPLPVEPVASNAEPQLMLHLAYDTVEIVVAYIDAEAVGEQLAARLADRIDVEALLGSTIRSSLTFAVTNRGDDIASDRFALEVRRADAFVTALAASVMQGEAAIASDAHGTLYASPDLLQFALHRCGRRKPDGAATDGAYHQDR